MAYYGEEIVCTGGHPFFVASLQEFYVKRTPVRSSFSIFSYDFQNVLEIGGQGGGEGHALAARRVGQFEFECVQKLPLQRKTLVLVAVQLVPHNRVPHVLCVHPYLVRSTRL